MSAPATARLPRIDRPPVDRPTLPPQAPPTRPGAEFTALPLRRRATWVVLLGSLTALGAFTVDLYLPAFPTLSHEFAASASSVQLTLTGSLAGVAVGQLLVGPASDALGRRRPPAPTAPCCATGSWCLSWRSPAS